MSSHTSSFAAALLFLANSAYTADTYTQNEAQRRTPAETQPAAAMQGASSSESTATSGPAAATRQQRSGGERSPVQRNSDDLARAVENELHHDPLVSLDEVQASASGGAVTLTGTTASLVAKERAERVAETVKGVEEVRNDVTVKPTASMSPDELATTIVQALLTNPATETYEVDVNVQANGRVRLAGVVDSWAERELAGRVARGVTGVTEVRNELQVKQPAARKDAELTAEIERLMRWDAYVDDSNVDVAVADGLVTLSGAVPSAAERRRAMSIAAVAGTTGVDARALRVDGEQRSKRLKEAPAQPRDQRIGAAQGQSAARAALASTDAEIAQAVRGLLSSDARITANEVNVDVNDGVVTLRGDVNSLQARRAATARAAEATGVRRVRDRMRIDAGAQQVSDAEISGRIVAALSANPVTEANQITVGVNNGVVTLAGDVDSWFERGEADEAAAGVRGVRRVTNNLTVADETERAAYNPYIDTWSIYEYDWYAPEDPVVREQDAGIAEEIRDELWWSPFVDSDDIIVSVENGVATLEGEVASAAELQAATENAFEGGAMSVVNELRVGG